MKPNKLFHIFIIALVLLQSLVYPWISILPAPPGVHAEESPPEEATLSASTPAPSPLESNSLDQILNQTLSTSTQSAETPRPEAIPEATPSASPEAIPETPISTQSATLEPQPSVSPIPTGVPSSSPNQSTVITSTTSPAPTSTSSNSASPHPIQKADSSLISNTSQFAPVLNPFDINLRYPFIGTYPISYSFGEYSHNDYISGMQSLFGVNAHDGIDFAMPIGTPILATANGTIISAGTGLYGTTIQIEHTWGISYYGHLSDLAVGDGESVTVGQIIGYSGISGITTGPHLHFGIRPLSPNLLNGYHGLIDPYPYFGGTVYSHILGVKNDKSVRINPKIRHIKNKFTLPKKSLKNDESLIQLDFAKVESKDLSIILSNPKGVETNLTHIVENLNGPLGEVLTLDLNESLDLIPGRYELTITDADGNYDTQDFSWGVLAINTNKTIYMPSSAVDFSMAVLDNQGDMVCDASINLEITSPSGIATKLSSQSGEVAVNLVTCLSKKYTLTPDYQTSFVPNEIGDYSIKMSATTADGTRSIDSNFRVQNSVPFDVERVTITRIYPRLDYPVILRIHAFEDYVGSVEDVIPSNFELINDDNKQNPPYTISTRGDNQVLTWNVVWQKGQNYVLTYQFNPPDKSPDFYTLGPLKIGNGFHEIKKWQLAIDVATTIILNSAHTILTTGTTWTVPSDWTDGNNTIEVIGGGGAGRTDTTGIAGAGGGGGGAYAKSVNISLTPGSNIDYQIGQGGIATSLNGTDTFFNRTSGTAGTCADTTSACAKGGIGATSATGAAGGLASSSFATGTGNAKNNGGTGGTGNTTADSGGGGGGAGGPNGAGGTGGAGDTDNATDGVGGGGGGNGGGAAGGSGITSDTIGANGGNGNGGSGGGTGGTAADGGNGTTGTGGGGGGGADNFDGGNGSNGSDLVSGVAVGSGGGGGGTGDTATTTGMGGNGGLFGGGGGGGRYGGFGAPGVIVITYNGNTPTENAWVVPSDWNSSDNSITVIGGGGAGVSSAQGTGAAGGGGGGYSNITNLSLTAGNTVTYQIGDGGRKTTVGVGAGTAGTATFFNRTAGTAGTCADTVSVCANPGAAGSGVTGGAGGSTTGADGTTLFAGGAGGAGNSTGDTGGGGGGAGGTTVGRVGGAGSASTSGGGGGGGGAGGTSSAVGQAGQTTTGGTGGAGPDGTGGGTAGNAGHGGAGTVNKGAGGGGGDDVFGGGKGSNGSSTTFGGGGGGGSGDNNTAATSQAYGGFGGDFGGGGGGGLTNGFGAEGTIIISYTPITLSISGTADGNDGATVKWAKNGTLQATTATIGSSTWTITGISTAPSTDDIITVWIDNVTDANESTAVTKYSSGDVTGMVLNTGITTVGSNQNTSLSITNLNAYDCSDDEDIMYQAVSSHLKIEGDSCAGSTTNSYSTENLSILGSNTLTVSGTETITTYDLTIAGTITSSGNSTYNITHNWTKTGTFTSSTSTVNFNGADSSTQSITGDSTFYNFSANTSANSAGRTLQFAGNSSSIVSGTLTLNGDTGKLLTLQSSDTNAWTIQPAIVSATYVSTSYSNNIGSAICATYSTDSGHNTSWSFSGASSCPILQVANSTDTTTTSGTYAQVSNMTITPGAGDYLVNFNTSIQKSVGTSNQYVSIFVAGSQVTHTERLVEGESSYDFGNTAVIPVSVQAYVSGVGASDAIEIRWYTTSGTATAHERTLIVQSVTSTDLSQVTATDSPTTTSITDVLLTGMTLTPGAGDYMVYFSSSAENSTEADIKFSIYVAGVQVAHSERYYFQEGSFPATTSPVSTHSYVSGVGASDAIEIRWRTSTGTATAQQRTLTVQKVVSANMTQATATSDITSTSTSDAQIGSMTLTPGIGDFLVTFSTSIKNTSDLSGSTQNLSIYVAGSQVSHSEREILTEDSFDSGATDSFVTTSQAYITSVGASDVIEVKYRTSTGTITAHQRTLTLQKITTTLPSGISGTADGNNGATVKVAVNGSLQAQTTTISSGTWNITGVTLSNGDIITVWIDGVADNLESTAVTKYASGSSTGSMILNTNVLTIGSSQDTSISLTDMNLYDCSSDEDIMHQVSDNQLKVEGDSCAGSVNNNYSSEKIDILSGDTLVVGGSETLTTYDISFVGTLSSSGASTYNIAHDWIKTGTFTSSSSTVNLNGAITSTQTLSGSTSFNNLTINNSGWYNASWSYRQKIVIDHTKITADQTDFPVFVNLADLPSGFHTHVNQTDARDIRVTKADGTTELPREVVFYTSASDTGELHFKYTGTLSSTIDTVVYIYYGNAGASDYAANSTYGAQNVWDNNFAGVWHLQESSGTRYDSTSNDNDLTAVNTVGYSTSGALGTTASLPEGAGHLTRSDANLASGFPSKSSESTTNYTASFWLKATTLAWNDWLGKSNNNGWGFYDNTNAIVSFAYVGASPITTQSSASSMTTNNWYHISTVHNATTDIDYVYLNGAQSGIQTGRTGDPDSTIASFMIGGTDAWPSDSDGLIDEVRVSKSARSASWTITEYNNQFAPQTFYSTPESESSNGDRTIAFTAGTTQTVTGSWTVDGHTSSPVILGSTSSSPWFIKPTSSTISYASVSKSINTGSSICATNSTDSGANESWSFASISGCSILQVGGVVDTTTTNASYEQMENMTITPGAGNYMVNFSASIKKSVGTSVQLLSIFVGGSQVTHTERIIDSDSSMDLGDISSNPVSLQAYVAGVGASDAIEIRWNTSSGTATAHERSLIVETVTSTDMFQATSTSNATTTSTSDVQLTNMTITPGAGNYLAYFSSGVKNTNIDTNNYFSFYVNGVQIDYSERNIFVEESFQDTSYPVMTHAYLSGVGASDVIEVKWRTSAGTATSYKRTLTLQKVSSSNMSQATATSDTTSTSLTDTQIATMTLTPGAGDYLVYFSGGISSTDNGGSTQNTSLYVAGNQITSSERQIYTEESYNSGIVDSFATSSVAYLTNVGASDVIEAKWRTEIGTITGHQRTLTVKKITSGSDPDSPTSLAQKTVADASITTGNWVSATSIKFTATATDTDNPDTLYLCVEKDNVSTAFSDTEDSCGTGVSYAGSGVAVSVTIASQTDATEYHWQARIKDDSGRYSSWVSYGANSDTTPGAARDYGLDTTAPTSGTVYDGTGVGVDTTYSDSSLSTLSANWDSFNNNVSGLNKYEYSIGTTIGGTDIKSWTDNTTSTTVTTTGLTLHTSLVYYVNVRVTDNAGNVSSPVSSNGQVVAPSLSFTVSPANITFSNLGPLNSYADTQTTTLTTSTNAYNGYVVRAFITDYLRNGATTIADFSPGTYSSPATWSGSETGFGYTSSDTTIGGSDKFSSGTLYAPFNHTGPGDIVADHTTTISGSPISNEAFTLTYKVKVPATQAAKTYSGTVIYTATAQY